MKIVKLQEDKCKRMSDGPINDLSRICKIVIYTSPEKDRFGSGVFTIGKRSQLLFSHTKKTRDSSKSRDKK